MTSAADPTATEALARYYRSAVVRERIWEYAGGAPGSRLATAFRLGGYGGADELRENDGGPVGADIDRLDRLLSRGADVSRSLADRDGTLLVLDVDYVSPDRAEEPYEEPARCFAALEPLHRVVLDVLGEGGIRPLVIMTGRGYHYAVRVRLGTPLHERLFEVGAPEPSLEAKARDLGPGRVVRERSHDGAGRVMEHVAHEVLRRVRKRTALPVALADVCYPPRGSFACLDLSAYGDSVFERFTRCAFSGHQKALMARIAPGHPYFIALPRAGASLADLLDAREDLPRAARLAARMHAHIPDAPAEDERLIRGYLGSALARRHREMAAGGPGPGRVPDLEGLPGCVREPLRHPDPLLLQPRNLRTVAFVLQALGCSPREIVELVRTCFEQEPGLRRHFTRYDAATRASFYVRIFCDALAAGLEPSPPLACPVQRELGICPGGPCEHDLELLSGQLSGRSRERP